MGGAATGGRDNELENLRIQALDKVDVLNQDTVTNAEEALKTFVDIKKKLHSDRELIEEHN